VGRRQARRLLGNPASVGQRTGQIEWTKCSQRNNHLRAGKQLDGAELLTELWQMPESRQRYGSGPGTRTWFDDGFQLDLS